MQKLKIKTMDALFYDELGLLIRNARKKQKISLLKLSKMTGISRNQLEGYELGWSRIKEDKWNLLCKVLGINPKIKVNISYEN